MARALIFRSRGFQAEPGLHTTSTMNPLLSIYLSLYSIHSLFLYYYIPFLFYSFSYLPTPAYLILYHITLSC